MAGKCFTGKKTPDKVLKPHPLKGAEMRQLLEVKLDGLRYDEMKEEVYDHRMPLERNDFDPETTSKVNVMVKVEPGKFIVGLQDFKAHLIRSLSEEGIMFSGAMLSSEFRAWCDFNKGDRAKDVVLYRQAYARANKDQWAGSTAELCEEYNIRSIERFKAFIRATATRIVTSAKGVATTMDFALVLTGETRCGKSYLINALSEALCDTAAPGLSKGGGEFSTTQARRIPGFAFVEEGVFVQEMGGSELKDFVTAASVGGSLKYSTKTQMLCRNSVVICTNSLADVFNKALYKDSDGLNVRFAIERVVRKRGKDYYKGAALMNLAIRCVHEILSDADIRPTNAFVEDNRQDFEQFLGNESAACTRIKEALILATRSRYIYIETGTNPQGKYKTTTLNEFMLYIQRGGINNKTLAKPFESLPDDFDAGHAWANKKPIFTEMKRRSYIDEFGQRRRFEAVDQPITLGNLLDAYGIPRPQKELTKDQSTALFKAVHDLEKTRREKDFQFYNHVVEGSGKLADEALGIAVRDEAEDENYNPFAEGGSVCE